jgi:hypothetical protein
MFCHPTKETALQDSFVRGLRVTASRRKTRILIGLALVGGLALCEMTSPVHAAPNCSNFFYNMDGSWSPTHPIMMASPTTETMVGPGDKFRPGMPGSAGRIGGYLTTHCRNMSLSAGQRIPRIP